jgi:hypothetical protein
VQGQNGRYGIYFAPWPCGRPGGLIQRDAAAAGSSAWFVLVDDDPVWQAMMRRQLDDARG